MLTETPFLNRNGALPDTVSVEGPFSPEYNAIPSFYLMRQQLRLDISRVKCPAATGNILHNFLVNCGD